jgi:hypothetical protein
MHIEKRDITGHDLRKAQRFGPARLTSCTATACSVVCLDFDQRVSFEGIEATRCFAKNCFVQGAILRECVFNGFRSSGNFFRALSCLYDRVTLRGRLGRLMLVPSGSPEMRRFDAQLAPEQAKVPWALDISGAEVDELDIRGVPADLIRRDTNTQAIVRAAVIRDRKWQSVASGVSRIIIELMLGRGDDSCVIVAPKRHGKRFAERMHQIEALRAAGLAE